MTDEESSTYPYGERREPGGTGRRVTDIHQVDLVVAAALSDVKVELAQLNTSVSSMAQELRGQDTQHKKELERIEAWQKAQDERLTVMEKWQWKVTGIAVAVGTVAGLFSSLLGTLLAAV